MEKIYFIMILISGHSVHLWDKEHQEKLMQWQLWHLIQAIAHGNSWGNNKDGKESPKSQGNLEVSSELSN